MVFGRPVLEGWHDDKQIRYLSGRNRDVVQDYFSVPPFCMEYPHDPEDIMTGYPVDRKIIMPGNILEERWIRRTAYRGDMQFHLYPADRFEVRGIDRPLGTFAVAFQKIAPPGYPDEGAERVRGAGYTAPVPRDPGMVFPSPSAPAITVTETLFSLMFSSSNRAVTGSTAVTCAKYGPPGCRMPRHSHRYRGHNRRARYR